MKLKVLIDSYNNVMQHGGGGVPMRIRKFMHYFDESDLDASLFNKWEDKLEDCDILHIFKANIDSYSQIAYAKNLGKKVVVSTVIPQEKIFRIKFAILLNKLFRINNTYSLLRLTLLLADALVAQTKKEANFISHVYGIDPRKIIVIPNGVNEDILNGYNPKDKKDILLYVGRFDSNKNQLSLIKALEGTEIECHFIGGEAIEEPNYYRECKELAGNNKRIHFHGWLRSDSEDFLALYKRAKVVALISHKEIFGNSLIEGGACGANLVATKELPVGEWGFGDTCISVNSNDINDIRYGLQKAFATPNDERIHDLVTKQFSWRAIADRHIDLYNSLLR